LAGGPPDAEKKKNGAVAVLVWRGDDDSFQGYCAGPDGWRAPLRCLLGDGIAGDQKRASLDESIGMLPEAPDGRCKHGRTCGEPQGRRAVL